MNINADPSEFAGKRVLVSGGTKGAGRATVDRFLAGGARVITAARSTREPIVGVEFVQADLTTAEGGETLANAALERMGGIDILAHVIGGSSSPGGEGQAVATTRPDDEVLERAPEGSLRDLRPHRR